MSSAAKTRRFVESVSVERQCACGKTFTRNRESRITNCPSCRERAREQAVEDARQQRAERNRRAASTRDPALRCGECCAPLRTPAPLCGFCIVEMAEAEMVSVAA